MVLNPQVQFIMFNSGKKWGKTFPLVSAQLNHCNDCMLTKLTAYISSKKRTLLWWTSQTNISRSLKLDFNTNNFKCSFAALAGYLKILQTWLFRILATLALSRIAGVRCLFLTEATILIGLYRDGRWKFHFWKFHEIYEAFKEPFLKVSLKYWNRIICLK